MSKRRDAKHGEAGAAGLEAVLGVRFRQPELLELALTHSSAANEGRGPEAALEPGVDNEQMEFLGDAVLGLLVAEALFREFSQCDEGLLTRLRANLVDRPRLVEVATAMGLTQQLKVGRSAETTGVRHKPAVLADAVEAVIAAVYLDSGLEKARGVVERFVIAPQRDVLRAALADAKGSGALRDAKSLLQEQVQAANAGRLRYVDVEQSGPAHQLQFTVEARLETADGERVLATASGGTKKDAQKIAARAALEAWPLEGEGRA